MAALALGLAACGADDPAPAGGTGSLADGLELSLGAAGAVVLTAEGPLARGPVSLLADCTGAPGAVPVAFSAMMPEHGHGTMPATIEALPDEVYRLGIMLPMTGRWEAQLDLQVGEQVVPLGFDIQVP